MRNIRKDKIAHYLLKIKKVIKREEYKRGENELVERRKKLLKQI